MKTTLVEIKSHPLIETQKCPYCNKKDVSKKKTENTNYFISPVEKGKNGEVLRCAHCGYSIHHKPLTDNYRRDLSE